MRRDNLIEHYADIREKWHTLKSLIIDLFGLQVTFDIKKTQADQEQKESGVIQRNKHCVLQIMG